MATLWISEYATMALDSFGKPLPLSPEPPLAEQTVSFTTTTQSNAFNAQTRFIGVISSAACHVLVGSNPTATTSKKKIPADQLIYFAVRGGDKIAAVTAS